MAPSKSSCRSLPQCYSFEEVKDEETASLDRDIERLLTSGQCDQIEKKLTFGGNLITKQLKKAYFWVPSVKSLILW
jgi:uncharacterized protein YlaN (UPF0358 family)